MPHAGAGSSKYSSSIAVSRSGRLRIPQTIPLPVAFVSGAAQGIGHAVALRLADDGFDVAVNDLASKAAELDSLVEAIRATGRKSLSLPADVSSAEEVEDAVQVTVKTLDSLDCMVANAGIAPGCPFAELTPEVFNQVIAVNLFGVYNCFRSAAKIMIAAGKGGRLIAASSLAGIKGYPMVAAYCASKFAVRGLMQSVALEYGKYGITANCYCPSAVDTPLFRGHQVSTEDVAVQVLASVAIGRIGEVDDVANVVSFLASEKSGYITGQSIQIDGGAVCS